MKKTILVMFLFVSFSLFLQSFAHPVTAATETAVAYAGIKEQGVAFDVTWNNHEGSTEIIIKDKDGNAIYRNTFTEAAMKKRFYLPKGENEQYSFIISNGKKRLEKKFLISTSFVETVNVNELK
ncbi:MAG: hypothetical protein K2X48_02760 [Chitinophagaceae bacterium]|nr:hypothetical protein [Chitinophagaceae bacterium]